MQDDAPETERPQRKLFDGPFLFIIAIAVASGAGVIWLKGADRFLDILVHDSLLSLALLPKIAAGVLIASALPFLLPRERVLKYIGPESGVRGLAIAALAGAVFPGGPSVTYPLTIGLMASGADLGAGMALVSAWILFGLNRTIIWELSFLPPHFVALRVALSLAAPVVFGLIVRRSFREVAT